VHASIGDIEKILSEQAEIKNMIFNFTTFPSNLHIDDLRRVIDEGNLEQLRKYLTKMPLENIKTMRIDDIYTPLEYAIQHNRGDMVLLLIQRGIDVNEIHGFGGYSLSPVAFAVHEKKNAIYRILSDHGGIYYIKKNGENTEMRLSPEEIDKLVFLENFNSLLGKNMDTQAKMTTIKK